MGDFKMNIDDRLAKIKYETDENSHLKVNINDCRNCKSKICTTICPANVYKWNSEENRPIINYENCLECGACRIACEKKSLEWQYPKGTKGVTYKFG